MTTANSEYSTSRAYTKLAVCITFHYVEDRLPYLAVVCRSLAGIAPVVDLTIITNTQDKGEHNAIRSVVDTRQMAFDFFVPSGLGHPYLLAWSHLAVFRKKFTDESYSHFLYLEDDLHITKENVAYWLTARELLRPFNLIPSFFRRELNHADNQWYSSDVMSKMSMYDCKVIDIDGKTSFIGIVYPYQGLYFLDRQLMQEHLEGISSTPDFDHHSGGLLRTQSHQIRERAALCLTFVNVPAGFRSRNVLPFDKATNEIKPECLIHHLPDTYANNPAHVAGKIRVNDVFIPRSIGSYFKKATKEIARQLLKKIIGG
jgi:hypothetical protein